MESTSELTDFLNKQIEIENKIVDSLNNALVGIENQAVRGSLKGVSLDSLKHAEMYRSAIILLAGPTPILEERHLDQQIDLVSKHIQMEEQLIGRLEEVMPSIGDEKVTLLLNAILSDERRHHELLKRILRILVRGETITEDDWWDALWKDVEELYLS